MSNFVALTGISESRSAYAFANYIREEKQSIVILPTEGQSKKMAEDLGFFLQKKIYILPPEDRFFVNYQARDHENQMKKVAIARALLSGEECVVVGNIFSAMERRIPPQLIAGESIDIKMSTEFEGGSLRARLTEIGYEFTHMVYKEGEFSQRGGIVDIFPAGSENPVRIELFGTEVDSIRTFDIDTQRSLENLRQIAIYPVQQITRNSSQIKAAMEKIDGEYSEYIKKREKHLRAKGESLETVDRLKKRRAELLEFLQLGTNMQSMENYLHYFFEEKTFLWDYMKEGSIYIEDADKVMQAVESRGKELKSDIEVLIERGDMIPKDFDLINTTGDITASLAHKNTYLAMPFPKNINGIGNFDHIRNFHSSQMTSFNNQLPFFKSEIKRYLDKGLDISLVIYDKNRIELIRHELGDKVLGRCHLIEGYLSSGFIFEEERVFITEGDIFATQKKARRPIKKQGGKAIDNFVELKKGDFVVHESYGIGRFLGIKTITMEDDTRDYLQIEYAGTEKLYVPVEHMNLVQKYIGNEGAAPRLSRLSTRDWQVTKAKAKAAIEEMAKELIELYARRNMAKGFQFPKDDDWQREFEESFPYVETEDQLRAIDDIKSDMENPSVMDRLLCGDVGFGKTEVAARAIFKCLSAGKQAAVLVPTTILANQHYFTLKERFEKFPFTVEELSRFRSQSQQDVIVEKLRTGQVDLVIGTHRILSNDVRFKDLGLLVVDEEQRFGVAHKEKIKKLKENIDVLTLSATPIPRTLNMSLSGIKDMSIIAQPPEDRIPVQTYVSEEDDFLIRDVIEREIDRGGQVFVLYNQVKGIGKVAEHIKELVPNAEVGVAHGQMNEHLMEDIMMSFVRGEFNVLVSTTIIESGIDIPNANTIVIFDADRFGLSQLYQLRGRVGRSNRMAFAYLMYKKDKVLTEVAQKRLKAIREFTEFGAGFKIAMRDLEIRGAGNFLGSEQSGHIMSIGYDLYCRLVEDTVKSLEGEVAPTEDSELNVELRVNGNIPNWYVDDESTKIYLYKKITRLESMEEFEDLLDEMVDRFGDVPKETLNLGKLSLIKHLASSLGAETLKEDVSSITTEFGEKNSLSGNGIFAIMDSFGDDIFVHTGRKPYIKLKCTPRNKLDREMEMLSRLVEFKGK